MKVRKSTVLRIFLPILILGFLIFFRNNYPVTMLKDAGFALESPVISLNGRFLQRPTESFNSEELQSAKAQISSLKSQIQDLQRALKFSSSQNLNLRGAEIIYQGENGGQMYFIINKGAADEVTAGDYVLDPNGSLAGKVVEVDKNYSKVIIASNAGEVYDVELVPSGTRAIAQGIADNTFTINFVSANSKVLPGDYVLLWNSSLVNTIPIAVVTRIEKNTTSNIQQIWAVSLTRSQELKQVFLYTPPPSPL